ncbi:hypothetical protein H6P81_007875 [Aristolochia fimbriata]|uniref:Uncharacterized protein n=1 Tax=Aristolochia fimbriata TaxID=158543 RepID=A0AAV7F2Q5_ARIFI|nr:hypothetical protein H6P81_007875 [Aristolochia fimbriata]
MGLDSSTNSGHHRGPLRLSSTGALCPSGLTETLGVQRPRMEETHKRGIEQRSCCLNQAIELDMNKTVREIDIAKTESTSRGRERKGKSLVTANVDPVIFLPSVFAYSLRHYVEHVVGSGAWIAFRSSAQ